ncbi:MAG: helix-turn-helix transcriptional regulator [Burkholderiaceae bacterium]
MDIGSRLRGERERLQLTQTQLAKIASASKHAQIKWEKGEAYPNAAVLSAWAEIGMDVLYVVTGERANVPTSAHLPPKEQMIMDAYRAGTPEQQEFILKAALGFSGTKAPGKTVLQRAKKVKGVMMAGDVIINARGNKKNDDDQ